MMFLQYRSRKHEKQPEKIARASSYTSSEIRRALLLLSLLKITKYQDTS